MKFAKITFLAVGIITWASLTGPGFAVDNSGIGGKPANPREDNPRSASIFVHEIEPGGSVEDAVELTNNTGERLKAEVYAVDAIVSSGGAFACEQKADEPDREGSWIKLEKDLVELDPNSSEIVKFKISVPKNTAVGEHNACIAIKTIGEPQPSGVGGVELSFRSAIRVTVTIPGEFDKQLKYESLNIIKRDDKLIANQVLFNSGNVSLDANLKTELKTFFGLSFEQVEGEYPVLAGQNAEFNIELKKPIWGGFYQVTANATFSTDPNSSLGEESETKDTVSISKYVFVLPHPLVGLALLVLLFAVLIPFILKRKKDKELTALKSKAMTHTVKKNEDIVSISNKYMADWKVTAKLNNLSAPYVLAPKQELLVVPAPDYKEVADKKKPIKTKKPIKSEPAKATNASGVIKGASKSPKKPAKKSTKKKE